MGSPRDRRDIIDAAAASHGTMHIQQHLDPASSGVVHDEQAFFATRLIQHDRVDFDQYEWHTEWHTCHFRSIVR